MPVRSTIRAFRRGGKSLRAAAKELGVPVTTLLSWEKSQNAPTLERALRVAKHFGVPVEALWQLDGERGPDNVLSGRTPERNGSRRKAQGGA